MWCVCGLNIRDTFVHPLVWVTTYWRFSRICVVSTWAMNFSTRFSSTSWATSRTHSGNGAEVFFLIPKCPIRIPTVKTAAPPRANSSTFFSMVEFSHSSFSVYAGLRDPELHFNSYAAVRLWRTGRSVMAWRSRSGPFLRKGQEV